MFNKFVRIKEGMENLDKEQYTLKLDTNDNL